MITNSYLILLPPFVCKQNQATDSEKKVSWALTRDDNFNFRAAHWADLHGLLYNALPPNILLWGHLFLSFCISEDKTSVKIKAKVLQTDEEIEIVSNLLVAADGSLSSIRQSFLPGLKLRFLTKTNENLLLYFFRYILLMNLKFVIKI